MSSYQILMPTRCSFCTRSCVARRAADVSREDVHDAWSAWMTLRAKGHEAIVPYPQLEPQVQAEDNPFVVAIRRVAKKGLP